MDDTCSICLLDMIDYDPNYNERYTNNLSVFHSF